MLMRKFWDGAEKNNIRVLGWRICWLGWCSCSLLRFFQWFSGLGGFICSGIFGANRFSSRKVFDFSCFLLFMPLGRSLLAKAVEFLLRSITSSPHLWGSKLIRGYSWVLYWPSTIGKPFPPVPYSNSYRRKFPPDKSDRYTTELCAFDERLLMTRITIAACHGLTA
jgi:hypothetical protein